MDITLIIGLVAASLTTFAFLPQSLRAIKTRHTKDISLPMLIMLEIGVIIWIGYGVLIKDIPLICANTVSVIFVQHHISYEAEVWIDISSSPE